MKTWIVVLVTLAAGVGLLMMPHRSGVTWFTWLRLRECREANSAAQRQQDERQRADLLRIYRHPACSGQGDGSTACRCTDGDDDPCAAMARVWSEPPANVCDMGRWVSR